MLNPVAKAEAEGLSRQIGIGRGLQDVIYRMIIAELKVAELEKDIVDLRNMIYERTKNQIRSNEHERQIEQPESTDRNRNDQSRGIRTGTCR
jgi:hypothetical protein